MTVNATKGNQLSTHYPVLLPQRGGDVIFIQTSQLVK